VAQDINQSESMENPSQQTSLLAEIRRLFALIRDEWTFYGRDWTQPGFRAMAVYRFGAWRARLKWRIIRAPLWPVYRFLFRYVRNHYGIEIPAEAQVGKRLRIRHQHGVTVHDQAVIGDDCELKHMVTVGGVADGHGFPTLEDRVVVGVGAVVVGGVTIGEDAMIGPNAVVLTDVPAGARAFGNPARIMTPPSNEASEEEASGGGTSASEANSVAQPTP